MKRSWQQSVAIFLILSIMIGTVGCKKAKKPGTHIISEKDPFFDVEEVECQIPVDESKELQSLWIENESICFVGNTISMTCEFNYKMPEELNEKVQKLISEDKWDEYYAIDKEYRFAKSAFFDLQGNLLRMTDVDFGADEDEHNNQTSDEVLLPDGRMVCSSYGLITVLDKEGNVQKSKRFDDEGFVGVVYYQQGKYYALCYKVSDDPSVRSFRCFQELNVDTLELVGEKIRDPHMYSPIKSGNGNYLVNTNGIMKVDLIDASKDIEMLSWSDTDYDPASVLNGSMKAVSDEEFVFWYKTEEYDEITFKSYCRVYIAHAKKAEKNPYAGKKLLTAAGYDSINLEEVISYNTSPDAKCRIAVHNYALDIPADSDNMNKKAELIDKIYLDVISGNGPDILLNFAQFSQFNSEKVCVDLNTYLDASDEKALDRSKYFDNVIRAQETGGKLYHMPISFELRCLAGNPDLVGAERSWTFEEFNKEMDKLPSDVSVMEKTEYETLLEWVLSETGEELIDYEKKEVRFEDDSFKEILAFVKKYGVEKREHGEFNDYDPRELFVNGMLAWCPVRIYKIIDLADFQKNYGEDTVFCGVPSFKGGSIAVDTTGTIGISQYSLCQDEAWDYLRFLLETQEESGSLDVSDIPISRSALDKECDRIIEIGEEKMKNWEPIPGDPFQPLVATKETK
jgi:ABC-type glycerol-3-phosphate transport system substrate-binding protein